MAIESLPESACPRLENFVVAFGTVSAKSSEQSLYPATELLLPDRTRRWWTDNSTSGGPGKIDLGTAKLPTFLALIDSNLDSAETLILKGADDSGTTTRGGRS